MYYILIVIMEEKLKNKINSYCKYIKRKNKKIHEEFKDLSHDIQGFLRNRGNSYFYDPLEFEHFINGDLYKISINRIHKPQFSLIDWNICSLDCDKHFIEYIETEPYGAEDKLLSVVKEIYYGKDRTFLFPNKDDTYYRSILNMNSEQVSTTYISNAVYFCHRHTILNIIEKFKKECKCSIGFSWELFEESEIYQAFNIIDKTIQYLDEKILMDSSFNDLEKELYGNDLTFEILKDELLKMKFWFEKQTGSMLADLKISLYDNYNIRKLFYDGDVPLL